MALPTCAKPVNSQAWDEKEIVLDQGKESWRGANQAKAVKIAWAVKEEVRGEEDQSL